MRSVLSILYVGVFCFLFYSCQKELSVDNGPTTSLPTAKVWKNGIATSLTNRSYDAGGYSIFVK